ncbi:hypothetical protein KIPB_017124, partial [Kipferlia bialata]|eukprot:g17124.t1
MLVPGRIQHVLCTGNMCNIETQEYVQTLVNMTPETRVVLTRGSADDVSDLPEQ